MVLGVLTGPLLLPSPGALSGAFLFLLLSAAELCCVFAIWELPGVLTEPLSGPDLVGKVLQLWPVSLHVVQAILVPDLDTLVLFWGSPCSLLLCFLAYQVILHNQGQVA